MDKCRQKGYKAEKSHMLWGNCLGFKGGFCPAGSFFGRATVSGIDAGASLLGCAAEDKRDALVPGAVGRSMGGSSELFRFGVEVFCAGCLDWLEQSPPV